MVNSLQEIDDIDKIKVLDECDYIPVGEYKIFSEGDSGIGFYLSPIGNTDAKNLLYILKYKLKKFINQKLIEVLA